MAHTEKATQERYKFAKEKKIPYGRLEDNDEYLDMRKEQAKKYREIATANPLVRPSEVTYNPAAGNVSNKPASAPSTSGVTYDAVKAERAKRDAAKNKTP